MISGRFLMRLPTSLRADFYVRQHGGKVHLESVLRRFRFFVAPTVPSTSAGSGTDDLTSGCDFGSGAPTFQACLRNL